MSDNRIKVAGYAQRVFYDNGIEYRNFADDLVGNQFASQGGTPLFTIGNFRITTNLDDKISKLFYTSNFSDFIDLNHLNFSNDDIIAILTESNKIKLNLDKSELTNYALFGSLTEYIRVSLENIILNWPASLLISSIDPLSLNTGTTVNDYYYDTVAGLATFKVSTNRIINNFGINYQLNGNTINNFTNTNDLRNLTVNYGGYVVSTSNGDFDIINFTPSITPKNDYIYITVNGDAFNGYSTFDFDYHIKPNSYKIEKYFKTLNDLESNLLNRFSDPIYTSKYSYTVVSENGSIILSEKSVTWPVSDGYNIDFESEAYIRFVGDLLEMAESSDSTKTNLVNRFFVSESITDFDTLPSLMDNDFTSGQKINSLLKIYGREFDDIKRYIDGIAFVNVISYDKKNNTPDALVKNLARVMGWDVTSSILEIDLINNYLSVNNSTFSGHSVSLSPIEAEVELWRRLIANTPWLWKSKGTRKAIEFLLKFIGTPDELITFDEFIYVADKPKNMSVFNDILLAIDENNTIDGLNIDSNGFPLVQEDTPEMYFQKAGLWYRETGGPNATIDILSGNNPHIGPYDGGQEYINQFRNLIPNFSAVTLVTENVITTDDNIFTNYDEGTFNKIFNNDVVVSYNTLEWLDNLNLNVYNSLIEELTGLPVQPDIKTCGGVLNIEMHSYLDDVLIQTDYLNGVLFSGGTIISSATTLTGFITFLDNTVTSLNSTNSTELYNLNNGYGYDIIDVVPICEDGSFYFNKRLDVKFETSFSYSCDGGDCNPRSLGIKEINPITGLVIFGNVVNNVVPYAECCVKLGFDAVPVAGGYNCYAPINVVDCSKFTPAKPDINRYMLFYGPDGITYYVPSAQCCPIGTTPIGGSNEYKCLVNELPCVDYTPSGTIKDMVLFSTPSGTTNVLQNPTCCPSYSTAVYSVIDSGYNCVINCPTYTGYTNVGDVVVFSYSGGTYSEVPTYNCCPVGTDPKLRLSATDQQVYICVYQPVVTTPSFTVTNIINDVECKDREILITGTPGDVINYYIEVLDNGNYGFTSVLTGDNNVNYPAMSSGVNFPPIIIPSDGTLVLTWEMCARPSLRGGQSNCVSVNIVFTYNGVIVETVNSNPCSI